MQNIVDAFISISGPYFLLYFTAFGLGVIYITKWILSYDHTHDLQVPEPTKLSSLDIALLRKGIRGGVNHAIFNLWQKKLLNIDNTKKAITIRAQGKKTKDFNNLEKEIYQFTKSPRYMKDLFGKEQISKYNHILSSNFRMLEKLLLLPDSTLKSRYLAGFLLALLIICSIGGSKLYFGLMRDKPVTLLIILLLVLVVWLFAIIKPHKVQLTNLGVRFLKLCEDRFSWIKESDKGSLKGENDNLLFGAAVFGVAAMASYGFEDSLGDFTALEKKMTSSSGSGCSSCGGGCSGGGGCSSGCGGGGCSSGCGGGCGGCGG